MPPKKKSTKPAAPGPSKKPAAPSSGRQTSLGDFFATPAGYKAPEPVPEKPAAKATAKAPKGAKKPSPPAAADEDELEKKLDEMEVDEDGKKGRAEGSRSPSALTPEPMNVDETEEPAASATEKEPVTKKRGRRPAKVKEEDPKSASASEDEPVSKRSRKSKATAKETQPAPASDDEPVSKRSRKSKGKATAKVTESAPALDDEPAKSRGRPKKSTKNGSTSPEKTSKKTAAADSDAAAAAASDAEAESESKYNAAASDADVEEGKGRKSKSRSASPVNAKERQWFQQNLSDPSKTASSDWKAGEPVPYAALTATFTKIENTTKRLEKIKHSASFMRQVLRLTPDELLLVVHLMVNKLAADYEGIELGVGESLLIKAIAESCGRSVTKIKEDHKVTGDLGTVALMSRNTQRTLFKPKALTVRSVHESLKTIATIEGTGGQGRKVANIQKLLTASQGDEAKYIVRGLEGKLRLGLAHQTVIVALSQAVIVHQMTEKGETASIEQMAAAEENLKTVFSELPNYDVIIPAMLTDGIMNIQDTCKLQPGVPLKPMLAKPAKSISEVLDRIDNKRFTCEYKYDGERAQIHYVAAGCPDSFPTIDSAKGTALIFSRNSENLSQKYPDILEALTRWVEPSVTSFVIDCEAVGWNREEKHIIPFQQLQTRKRKDVNIADIKIQACVFAFDLLFLNGEPLVNKTLEERRTAMHAAFKPTLGEFAFAEHSDGTDSEMIQEFLDKAVKASCEGLMVKMLDGSGSGYLPSKRCHNWLKVKKDYLASAAADSLDLAVVGGYHGKGKRTSWYGAFLLACYNPETEEFETICKVGTGFSEALLEKLAGELAEHEIERPKPFYKHAAGGQDQPDVWFDARVLWEISCADLTLSPRYKAASGVMPGGKGVSLRFPRFIRIRDDKKPEDATTDEQVREMYLKQDVVANAAKIKTTGNVDDDFEY